MKRLFSILTFALLLSACGREVTLEQETVGVRGAQCFVNGSTKAVGDIWEADCNTCHCTSHRGEAYIACTEMACGPL